MTLAIRFLGTSTIVFDDGTTAIMTDGFFSRPSALRVLFGRLKPNRKRIMNALKNAKVKTLAALFVAHSHHDHAMDAAVVARETGAMVIGSESTENIVRGGGHQRFQTARDGDTFRFGDFTVTTFTTPHSPKPFFPGKIAKPLRMPARLRRFREGGNYSYLIEHTSGRRILVVPSCNFICGKFKDVRADTVFLSIGQLGKQDDAFAANYWQEVVRASGARLVIPIHWDSLTGSLRKPLKRMPWPFDNVRRSEALLEQFAHRDGITLRRLEPFVPLP